MIRNNLETSLNSSTDQVPDSVFIFCGVSFEQFNVVSEADIRKIITSSPTKSCALDPIPTWLLKQCQDQLAPVLTTIVKASLSCAEFPTELKKAFLTPLIKKIILDCEIFKNYRPVSNLSFISKLVERVVCVQLVEHLKTNNSNISVCLQTTSQHRDGTPSCTKWSTPSRWQWGRGHFSTAWFKCCIWYHRPSEIIESIKSVFWNKRCCS